MKSDKKTRLWRVVGVFVLSAAILYGTFTAGFVVAGRGINPKIVPGSLVKTNVNQPSDIDFSLFWTVWNKVHSEFVGTTDDQQMVYDAINGALLALNDPYTVFLPPEINKKFQEEISGKFEGIGAELSIKNSHLTIVSPLDDSPAAKAGLLAGDIIDAIGGKKTINMTVDQAVDLIRGPKDTEVVLTIIRQDVTKDYTIKRQEINVKSVKTSFLDKSGLKIGVLKINQFSDDTSGLVNQFADECLSKKCGRIIIDLRNNPGGLLDSAIDVASVFLKEGVVVKEVAKDGTTKDYRTTLKSKLSGKPIIILINGGSASASEILTGALVDHNLATTVGEKSFGKGSVQAVDDLPNGAALKVTIAHWLTPNGTVINGVGITPKTEIKMSEADTNAGKDPQMDAAMAEIIK